MTHKTSWIITPNRRRAAFLLQQYDKMQQQSGHLLWERQNILPLEAWIDQLWLHHGEPGVPLLKAAEPEVLCYHRLAPHQPDMSPVSAQHIMSAYERLLGWHIPLDALDTYADHAEVVYLQQALQQWQLAQRTYPGVTLYEAIQRLISVFTQHKPTDTVQAIGFEQAAPLVQQLLACFPQTSTCIIPSPTTGATAHKRAAFPDELAEWGAMAEWVLQRNQAHPHAQIACIFPHLDMVRPALTRFLKQTWRNVPWAMSGGTPLTEMGAIQTLLTVLAPTPIEWPHYRTALLHPSLHHHPEDRHLIGVVDEVLTSQRLFHPSRKQLLAIMHQHSTHFPHSQLAQRLHAYGQLPRQMTTATAWIAYLQSAITCLGWMRAPALNSEEYQLLEAFTEVLTQHRRLDEFTDALSYRAQWRAFQQALQKRVFQPNEPDNTPIFVLGALEAQGITFDYLWIAGLTDQRWPPKPHPHPLLPLALQRDHHLPHATLARQFAYAEQLQQDWEKSAHLEMIASYTTWEGETPLRPSALLTYPDITVPSPAPVTPQPALETWISEMPVPVPPHHTQTGGVSLLKEHAACPFRAFVLHRLKTRRAETETPGLTARERGQVTHHLLERLWQHWKTQDTVLHLTAAERQADIEAAVIAVCEPLRRVPHLAAFWQLEQERLIPLITHWIEKECQRPPFRVVATEQTLTCQVGPLSLNIRLDRIDEINPDTYLVIDYKTSATLSTQDWQGPRLREPQLPLYAASKPHIAGIAYAALHPNQSQYRGLLAAENLLFSNMKHLPKEQSWNTQLTEWKQDLTALATDLMAGNTQVDPRDPAVCMRCELHAVCRKSG
ncbi:MAG: hypothetical protein A3J38_10155 [Gammaproteobacteria bacterium RIFCSPHIGHO2_12_FULL_45_9]|nr:MAG: hypothetical protein A3J38_10155 [Gammaproteobacteria bacterium RIFCSPHIGHO2_12_FULL_45_9]